eukprot:3085081-Amphidinium_carterae.1
MKEWSLSSGHAGRAGHLQAGHQERAELCMQRHLVGADCIVTSGIFSHALHRCRRLEMSGVYSFLCKLITHAAGALQAQSPCRL